MSAYIKENTNKNKELEILINSIDKAIKIIRDQADIVGIRD
jgi:predicted transcriptional regulator